MVNQLCRSTETNHHIAESITVSHGNTPPRLSVFIKLGRVPALAAAAAGREGRPTGVCLVCTPKASRAGCDSDSDKEEIAGPYQERPDLRWNRARPKTGWMMIYGWQGKQQQTSLSGTGKRSSRTLITNAGCALRNIQQYSALFTCRCSRDTVCKWVFAHAGPLTPACEPGEPVSADSALASPESDSNMNFLIGPNKSGTHPCVPGDAGPPTPQLNIWTSKKKKKNATWVQAQKYVSQGLKESTTASKSEKKKVLFIHTGHSLLEMCCSWGQNVKKFSPNYRKTTKLHRMTDIFKLFPNPDLIMLFPFHSAANLYLLSGAAVRRRSSFLWGSYVTRLAESLSALISVSTAFNYKT